MLSKDSTVILLRWFTVATIMPLVYYLPLTHEQTTVLTGLVVMVNNMTTSKCNTINASKREED
jgi:hypothetical protein